MIGIIPHISVMERTKEIGVLRALGASKSNISQVFIAETIMVGLIAGLLGIGMTQLLIIPVNAVIHPESAAHHRAYHGRNRQRADVLIRDYRYEKSL